MDNLYNNDGISICITAYKSVDTLKETLDSVISQSWFKTHEDWEILLGIDCCKETLEYTKTIMNNYKNLRVFMMDSNKGTYITSNTLFSIAKYENILRFDSDDIMFETMVEELMNNNEYDLQRFRLVSMKTGKLITYYSWGQQFVKKHIFEKFGGYRPWPCAADHEFIERTQKFINLNLLDKPLFLYRSRENSLTHDKKTSMQSNIRLKLAEFINKSVYKNEDDAKIECITNTYQEIFSDIYDNDPETYMYDVVPVKCEIKYTPNNKIVKRELAYTRGSELPQQKAVSVKIINTPIKRKIIASKGNLI